MKHAIPEEVLKGHTAVLGMTGSGKTSTEKLLIEQVVAGGARVCVLDTLKSDWWGITSSASGKSPGLPFRILGGPRGHVPLHSSAGKVIGQLVGTGKLPLSIVDMADFEAGGIQRFFIDFAQSLWKHARGVVYVVIEEAHELAPKERAGFGGENMALHWAKKLATGSRTKGIRLIVASQRVQALHNAVLGSCQTVIAHQLMFDADQDPVIKWVKSINKTVAAEVTDSIASLPIGTGWICSGRAQIFEKRHFPKFKTYDNTATPDGDGDEIDVKMATVDHDELRALIGDAVKQAEADDPKLLRAANAKLASEKAALERQVAHAIAQNVVTDPTAIATAEERGYTRGWDSAVNMANNHIRGLKVVAGNLALDSERFTDALQSLSGTDFSPAKPPGPTPAPVKMAQAGSELPKPSMPAPVRTRSAPASSDGALPGNQRRLINSLATWLQMGEQQPNNAQVAWLAGYSPSSTSYTNPRSALKTAGLIDYPLKDRIALTSAGGAVATPVELTGSLLDFVLSLLPGNEARVLRSVASHYPQAISNDTAATGANYTASSTSYTNPRSALRTKDLITYPVKDQVRATDWLFAK